MDTVSCCHSCWGVFALSHFKTRRIFSLFQEENYLKKAVVFRRILLSAWEISLFVSLRSTGSWDFFREMATRSRKWLPTVLLTNQVEFSHGTLLFSHTCTATQSNTSPSFLDRPYLKFGLRLDHRWKMAAKAGSTALKLDEFCLDNSHGNLTILTVTGHLRHTSSVVFITLDRVGKGSVVLWLYSPSLF